MTPIKALGLTVASAVTFTLLGGTVGFCLGRFTPTYYRTIAQYREGEPCIDPIEFGIGQGVTQGLVGGIAVGILLVVFLAWLGAGTLANRSVDQPKGNQ